LGRFFGISGPPAMKLRPWGQISEASSTR